MMRAHFRQNMSRYWKNVVEEKKENKFKVNEQLPKNDEKNFSTNTKQSK